MTEPGEFAVVEDGDAAVADGHAAAEGLAEPEAEDVGSESTLREMLMSTDPDRRLEEVDSPWDPERGGMTRVYRGLMKATGIDGLPAIADVVIGLGEFVTQMEVGDLADDDGGDGGGEGMEEIEIDENHPADEFDTAPGS